MSKPAKKQQHEAPLCVDPALDEVISYAADCLDMTKRDFLIEASFAYLKRRREERQREWLEEMGILDVPEWQD